MRRKLPVLVCLLSCVLGAAPSHAVWIWTPETGKFVNPKWSVKSTPTEQLDYALGLYQAQKFPLALTELKKLIRNYPRAKEAPEAQYYIGQIMERMDKPYEAYKAYQVVIDKYPFSERAAEIVELQYNIANQMLEGKGRRGKIKSYVLGSDDRLLEIFRTVIKNAPYGKFAAISQYKIGLFLKERGLYQESRDEFEKTINDYPSSEWAKAAKFQVAMADTQRSANVQHEQKVTSIAKDEFKEFIKSHPESELTAQAKEQVRVLHTKEAENAFIIAKYYEKQKNFKSAGVYYKDIINQYADTPWGPKALARLKAIGQ